jgi:hypothetical protein
MGSGAFTRLLAVALACTTLVVHGSAFARGGGGHSSSHSSHPDSGSSGSGHSGHHKAEGVARDSHGKIARSSHAKDAFKRQHPCPSTGRSSGACPGYVIDHVIALKRGAEGGPVGVDRHIAALVEVAAAVGLPRRSA